MRWVFVFFFVFCFWSLFSDLCCFFWLLVFVYFSGVFCVVCLFFLFFVCVSWLSFLMPS